MIVVLRTGRMGRTKVILDTTIERSNVCALCWRQLTLAVQSMQAATPLPARPTPAKHFGAPQALGSTG